MNALQGPDTPESAFELAARPITGGERLVALDFIRGVAVLGIAFANVTAFAHPWLAYYWPGALPGGGDAADRWIWLAQFVLIDGKFRGIFTLLFGAGLALFIDRVREAGGSAALQMRRLLLLGLFGLAHFTLLFTGDVLFMYAVGGLVALAFVDAPPRQQLVLGLAWYLVAMTGEALMLAEPAILETLPQLRIASPAAWNAAQALWQARLSAAQVQQAAMSVPNLAATIDYRIHGQGNLLPAYVYLAFIDTIPIMLVGMASYRFGLFSSAFDTRRLLRWGWLLFLVGASVSLAQGLLVFRRGFPPQLTAFIFNEASALPRLPMFLGMVALLTAWAPRACSGRLGARVIAAGRMAFSNYIGTSLLMVLVFEGWAGGLYGTLHRAQMLVVVALAWAAMLAWSKPWLGRFRYGPLEWLWRCLTYGRRFALRR